MAITRNEIQVQWGAVNSVSVASGSEETSDSFAVDATCFQAMLQAKADHGGTPASGDVVRFYLLATLGDPDGDVADEYGTDEQDVFLLALDTNADDPAVASVQIPMPIKGGKILAKNDGASAITVSAIILEQRG